MATPALDCEDLSTAWVANTYGVLIPAKDLARLLGFSSTAALRRAHATGRLSIPMFQLEGRRGWFAHVGDVCAYLRAKTGGARRTAGGLT